MGKGLRGYNGWAMDVGERDRFLVQFPPLYPNVIAHHVTHQFNVGEADPRPGTPEAYVVGWIDDPELYVQALVIEINGTTVRPDGLTYHLTWSNDHSKGARAKHSNDALKRNP
ncbi:MAG: hypothetical protein EOP83_09585 [Verrucomicrobiaceae bacterium]|nr:MAG: hypothetical protein EOP83_09585 [Verrucomicrobiaceae bacterium]